jgi:hypothetical protein
MNKKNTGRLKFIFIGLFLFPMPAFCTVDGAIASGIATALGGKTVSNIVNDVRQSGTDLIDQATHTGNALIARSGNEANVLAGNLDAIFKENMEDTFDNLSEERKAIIIEAEALRRNLTSVKDSAYSFKDSTALDLNALFQSIPFIKDKFFVQSIRGLSYLPQVSDFKLQIAATSLGIQDNISTKVSVYKKDGESKKLIPNIIVDQSKQRFFAEISIPNSELASSFSDTDLVVLPLIIQLTSQYTKGWWIFSHIEEQTHEIPVYINLFPRKVATITSSVRTPTYSWVKIDTKFERYTTPNRHCDDDCRGDRTKGGNRIEFAVAPSGPSPDRVNNKKLVNPQYRCIAQTCGWSGSFNLRLTNYDSRLIFTWDTWSRPGTWEVSADVLEYQITGESIKSETETTASFGRLLEIILPIDTSYSTLKVRTFTKNDYEILIDQPDPYGILTYQGKSKVGSDRLRYTYRVNDPSSVVSNMF